MAKLKRLSVVGESFYRANIDKLVGITLLQKIFGRPEEGFLIPNAKLELEDDNPHDPGNSVKVLIEGLQVGHLAKAKAAIYRRHLEFGAVPTDWVAAIRGGYFSESKHRWDWSIVLHAQESKGH